ncbi:ATP-binding protein [Solimicrobium silvestre]|uniref:histidine kinase n=1 Tax=Solimicrobium silvestre TaxID=2099400 RepID=A0A2S9H1H7_9BURK|nr:ATP-binding protein [Solimicrobium silvestre]PRC93818.1 Signal transduction histidine kinase [Solimicrobium silvestre]
MNRLLPRFILLVLLSVTVASVAVYFAISYWFGDPLEEIARKQSAAQIFLLEQFVDKAPTDEWLVRLNKVREVSNIKLELVPLNSVVLSAVKTKQLLKGEVVLDVPGKAFYRRVDQDGERYIGSAEDVIHVQGLPINVGLTLQMEAFRYAIVALFLLIPIVFWSRAHWRALQSLSTAADQFGEGQFGKKIVMHENATMYPLAQCMNLMAERIENLLSAHRTLLHSVSHELRTPIARLGFGLELLREESGGDQSRIQAMEADIDELNALVNELLNLTKLDHQQSLKAASFSVQNMLEELKNTALYSLNGKQCSIRYADNLGTIIADQRILTRALSNLIFNAVKYGNQQILISAHALSDGAIEFAVEDDGPGIPPNERVRVFEPFYRLDQSRDRSTGGFGLGLAIAQKAVQLHGSTIQISESALSGAKFYFVIARQ